MAGNTHQTDKEKMQTKAFILGNTVKDGSGTWYFPLVDSSGRLQVVDAGGGGAVTEYDEDTAHSSGDKGTQLLAVRKDTAATLVDTDGDYHPLEVDANGRLHVIEPSLDSIKTAVEIIDNAINGNEMQVDIVADGAGLATTAKQDTLETTLTNVETAIQIIDDWDDGADHCEVVGSVASDAVDSGNPVKIGGKSVNYDGTAPGTATAENDRTNFITDVYGRLFVETGHPNFWNDVTNFGAAQTNTALVAAPGAGLSLYITDIIFSCDTAGNMKLVEDTAGTPVDKLEVMYFAANGGCAISLRTPIKITANKDLGITTVNAGNHSINVCGYIAPG